MTSLWTSHSSYRRPTAGGSNRAVTLFQVASQFNLLEMVSPSVTPEEGVAKYAYDPTQGPACAIATGAGTIYRNYFVPVGDQEGQTADRQLDALEDLRSAMATQLGVAPEQLWRMENGYAFPSGGSLRTIGSYLRDRTDAEIDDLRARLRVGLHSDVEVTDVDTMPGPLVSQVYCSALPVGYSDLDPQAWKEFACLVQEAAYEATLLAGILNAARGASKRVLLTRIGGGVFGNSDCWINAAILRAIWLIKDYDLEVDMVSYRPPPQTMIDVLTAWQEGSNQEA